MAEPNEAAPLPTPVDPADPRAGVADVTGQWTEMHNHCHELVAELRGALGPATDRPAGDDTAPPAEDRAIQPVDWARREVLFLAREVCEYRGSEIGSKKLDQLAVALTTLDEKAAEKRAAAAGPRAGDTAPDDGDVRGWLHESAEGAADHEEAAMASRALSLIHDRGDEIDRLRSEAAALRSAGGGLASAVGMYVGISTSSAARRDQLREDMMDRVDAWRSAAGSPTTDGEASR